MRCLENTLFSKSTKFCLDPNSNKHTQEKKNILWVGTDLVTILGLKYKFLYGATA